MKPLGMGNPLASLSPPNYTAIQMRNQNPLHEEEGAWIQAPIEVFTESSGEGVFALTSSLIGRVKWRCYANCVQIQCGGVASANPCERRCYEKDKDHGTYFAGRRSSGPRRARRRSKRLQVRRVGGTACRPGWRKGHRRGSR